MIALARFSHPDISVRTETTDITGIEPANFSDLLPDRHWRRLPPAIRQRFARAFTPNHTVCYLGYTIDNRMSRLGWCLAQVARLVGSPLPLFTNTGPVAVTVTDHEGNAGQSWCRIYHRERGFAQCIQSIKRFRGPTGLEEYLGYGIAMALALSVKDNALVFTSTEFALYVGAVRMALPRWLSPGTLTVVHRERHDHTFEFILTLHHRLFGELIYQNLRFAQEPDKENRS